jgi:hypothetical protein
MMAFVAVYLVKFERYSFKLNTSATIVTPLAMPVSAYVPHLIYSTILTSFSFHLLFHKKQSEVDRAHLTAQISILETLAHRLRSGQDVSDEEIERLCRLAKTHEDGPVEGSGVKKEKIGWKDVFMGRKTEGDAIMNSETKYLREGESYRM